MGLLTSARPNDIALCGVVVTMSYPPMPKQVSTSLAWPIWA